jgi:D-tyrosyl-tRNA(Tyr) deacylase
VQLVIQRVSRAAVEVGGRVTGAIGRGLVVLVGVGHESTEQDARWLAGKTERLRVFPDEAGLMNHSVADVGGGVLAISQFTLYGDATKGNRPSFRHAAEPGKGQALYDVYCDALAVPVARGVFGAHMEIAMVADGPVTILLRR